MLDVKAALDLIQQNNNVALVGLSPKEDRPSNKVGRFLLKKGFTVIPVHPAHNIILEQAVKKDLSFFPENWDGWIDLFINPARLLDLVPQIKRIRPKLVWCQLGVINPDFNQQIEKAAIPLIVDHCPKIEWNHYPKEK